MSSTVAAAIAQARRDKLVIRHKAGLSADELADIRQAFELFDSDGSGGIDAQEMRVAMRALGYTVTKEQVEEMVAGMDKDGGGSIEYGEFLSLMLKQASTRSSEEGKHTLVSAGQRGSIEYGEFLSLMLKQALLEVLFGSALWYVGSYWLPALDPAHRLCLWPDQDLQGVFATMLALGPASTPGGSRTAPRPALTLAHLKAVCQEMREEVSEQDLQPPRSQTATQAAASEPGPSAPPPAKRSKRTKAEQAAEPTQPTSGAGKGKGKAARPTLPALQPGIW
ncbi:hypothetical protein QJQ45_014248 [Haematococcus lacustris]|nr:hypothetical protein QJQ45_014248 [Haematococcus lacustris]